MNQLFRREFLLKVLLTIGTVDLVDVTGFDADKVLSMSMGQTEINDADIEMIYTALLLVA